MYTTHIPTYTYLPDWHTYLRANALRSKLVGQHLLSHEKNLSKFTFSAFFHDNNNPRAGRSCISVARLSLALPFYRGISIRTEEGP